RPVRGIHHDRIRQGQQFLVKAVEERPRKLLRSVRAGKIRASDIANEQRIAGQNCVGCDDFVSSVTTRQTLSGVCPGVSSARIRTVSIFTSKPSVSGTWGNSARACAPI